LNDLKLALGAVKILDIPCGLVINRSDMGDSSVKEYADRQGLSVLMEIPFDRRIAEAYSRGIPLIESLPSWKSKFNALFDRINALADRV
jgi:MinD superfamily P-loop ATPase